VVEHTTHNRVVGGSNPPTATTLIEGLLGSGLLDRSGMLVALSGGPDSTALLLGLIECGIPVRAAHFDHALRPESAADANQVAHLCGRLGVELIVARRSDPLAPGSVQAAARAARYRFLEEALAKTGVATMALGHTADDLVEGALLHLLRGAGLAGMRGMPARRGPFVRPLLGCWRSQVEDFLAFRSVESLRDPSNRDLRYARVRVRLQLLPRLERDRPGLSRRLHRAALQAARLQRELELGAAALLGPNAGQVSLPALRKSAPAIRAEAFRNLHGAATGGRPGLDRRQLAALARLATLGRSGDSLDLPGGIRARLGYEVLEMTAGVEVERPAYLLRTRSCTGCQSPSAAHFRPGAELRLGTRSPGLRMRPLPGGRTRKLQDILVDAKVPRHLRDSLPLVFAGGELAWVPGVAIDARLASPTGVWAIHAEVVEASGPLLESDPPSQGVFPE
jgi:tRNA(Ile)-lysidine synthase